MLKTKHRSRLETIIAVIRCCNGINATGIMLHARVNGTTLTKEILPRLKELGLIIKSDRLYYRTHKCNGLLNHVKEIEKILEERL